jgi:HlyD family secretion protein
LVQAAAATRGPLRVVVSTNGRVEPIDDIEVRARLDGRVIEIPEPGRRVAADEVVARLDAGPVAGQVAAAESERLAALESLRAARAVADERRARAATDRGLFEAGALTRDLFAQSERAADEATAQLRHLEREVPLRVTALDTRIAELRAQRAATEVRAPFAGTLYRRQVKKGATVRVGDPLLWLADLERLRVRANVDQVDLGRVQPGQSVRVSANAFPGRIWLGRIAEVVPDVVVKDSRSVADGLATLAPPTDGLVPGMTVDVEIVLAESTDALQVPAEAVSVSGGASYVFLVDGQRLRRLPITTGLSSVAAVAITGGLDDGAVVVLGPTPDLVDGARVRVARRDAERR